MIEFKRVRFAGLYIFLIPMNRNSIGIIIVLIVVAGGWYLFSKAPASVPATETIQTPPETTAAATTPSSSETTVIYGDQGFSPKNITVSLGTTVTFVNQSLGNMWVASAAHPTHTAYSGTSAGEHCPDTANVAFDECAAVAPGNSYSFTFNKEGTWKYHNHIDASTFGTIIVTAVP